MVAALMGLFHSMCARCCLTVFFSLIGLLCVAELAVVIALFANLDGNVNNLLDYSIGQDAAASQNKKVKPPKTRRLYVIYISNAHNKQLTSIFHSFCCASFLI